MAFKYNRAMNQPFLLYTVISISVVIVTSVVVYIGYQLMQTLKTVNSILEDVKDTTNDIVTVKNGVKTGVLGLARSAIDGYLNKTGGDK